jgi:hypothetical protein
MSIRTTNLGPRVSINSVDGGASAGDTLGVLEIGVPIFLIGTANNTTADPDTTLLADGQFSITSVSVTSAVLAFRSGNTVYTFANDGTEA